MDYLDINLLFPPGALLWVIQLVAGCVFSVFAFQGKYPSVYASIFWFFLFLQLTADTLLPGGMPTSFTVFSVMPNALVLIIGFISRLVSSTTS